MVVYMLLNVVEERVYIGQTTQAFAARLKEHREQARSNEDNALYDAMRRWDNECWWEYVILENCFDQDELDAAERRWIRYCNARDRAVGYNTQLPPEKEKHFILDEERELYDAIGDTHSVRASVAKTSKKPSAFSQMSAGEKREFFRECGKRGLEKQKKLRVS